MTVSETVQEAARLGLSLYVDASATIRWEPKGGMTEPLRRAVREHKPKLLAILPAQAPDPRAHSPPLPSGGDRAGAPLWH